MNLQTEITQLTVKNAEDETDSSAVVSVLEWEDGSGWNIHAEWYGHAVGTITYKLIDGSGETKTHDFDIWVEKRVYYLDAKGKIKANENEN